MKIRLEQRSPAELIPYEKNAKVHDDAHVDALAASISQFGFNDPVGITEDGVVVEGNGRLMAALRLGLTSIPVIVLSDITERDAQLYRIAHNKTALNTGFDYVKLAEALRGLIGGDITFDVLGFDPESVNEHFTTEQASQIKTKQEVPVSEISDPLTVEDVIVIWDNDEQKAEFAAFISAIKGKNELSGEAMLRVLEDLVHGLPVAHSNIEHEKVAQ